MDQFWMDRCHLAWGNGTIELKEGVARNTWLQEARDFATWTQLVTGMGYVVRNFQPGTSGVLTVQIVQTSRTHKRLYDMAQLDIQSRTNVFPMVLFDEASGKTVTYSNAYILTVPDESYAMEAGIFPWSFGFEAKLVVQPNVLNRVGS